MTADGSTGMRSLRPAAIDRRRFLAAALAAALAPRGRALAQEPQGPLAGEGANGTLRDPTVVGRERTPTDPSDNSEAIKLIEQRLHCTCGCNLDIYTCRTTDFTCTYSPALHREVVALYDDGKTAQQILNAFVAKYGEKVLMAPRPEGFNLAGYLVPGAAIAAGGAALLLVIGRRTHEVAAAAGAAGAAPPAGAPATPEELERLRRALETVED
ncbi:MAG TPA: cytochrome c-type biogenesis protein CcmH [Gemmatimonadales bacterium]|nr:cytochrome c-type biogenesis protein CcmH [Gemmatimonadales bacterium]